MRGTGAGSEKTYDVRLVGKPSVFLHVDGHAIRWRDQQCPDQEDWDDFPSRHRTDLQVKAADDYTDTVN